MTHHGIDDIGILRPLPGMNIYTPCDPRQVRNMVPAILAAKKPAYLRLERSGAADIPGTDQPLSPDRPLVLRPGSRIALISCGGITTDVLAAAENLSAVGINPLVVTLPRVKPMPDLTELLAENSITEVVSIEEHVPHGGLGDALCAHLQNCGQTAPLLSLSLPDEFAGCAGSRQYLLKTARLDADNITERIVKWLKTLQ
jgi:transketolase